MNSYLCEGKFDFLKMFLADITGKLKNVKGTPRYYSF